MSSRRTTESAKLFSRAKELFPGGVNSPVRAFKSVGGEPFITSYGEGAYLIDADGNRYIDYINSWGPLVLGHAHPAVVSAISQQACLGTSYGTCCEIEAKLAELIISLMPNIEMLRFVNSGTEAGMSVLRLARGCTGKNKIIKFAGCYHGHADSLLSHAGSGLATLGVPDCAGVSPLTAQDTLTAEYNDLSSVEKIINTYPNEIAAVIVEPVVGNAGLITPQAGFLSGLRELTAQHKILLIFDEVMCGFRVHLGGAQTLYNVKPDLTMLGKVIGGGLPVGAFGGKKELMQQLAPLGPVYQAGTLSGNPLAMASGIATLSEWSKPGVFESASAACQQVCNILHQAAQSAGQKLFVQQAGTMFGFFFQDGPVVNFTDAKKSDLQAFNHFFHAMLEKGVYFAPSQFEAGFISAAHDSEAVSHTVDAIKSYFSLIE